MQDLVRGAGDFGCGWVVVVRRVGRGGGVVLLGGEVRGDEVLVWRGGGGGRGGGGDGALVRVHRGVGVDDAGAVKDVGLWSR